MDVMSNSDTSMRRIAPEQACAKDGPILVLASFGRDPVLITAALKEGGVCAEVCATADELCQRISTAGAAIVAEESLDREGLGKLVETLLAQPAWSDFPLLFLAKPLRPGQTLPRKDERLERLAAASANLTRIERPLSRVTMLSAVSAALRARRRQYEVRDMLDAQMRGLRQRDEFLAMLGHELRNPLAAINLTLALLDRVNWKPEAVTAHSAIIRRQVTHLGRMVDDLLDVGRITGGQITMRTETLDLAEIASRAVDAARPSYAASNLELRLDRPAGEFRVKGDPIRLEQVIANLLTNAAKFTPANGTVKVAVLCEDHTAVLRVSDTGRGIPHEKIEEIFELFAQAHVSIDRNAGGLGLGLYVARRLIDAHNGSIHAESDGPGRGATFVVRLPLLNPCKVAEKVEPGEGDGAQEIKGSSLRVLLVEDSPDTLELMRQLLLMSGHEVLTASCGTEGLALAIERRPHMALLDIGLPGMDGLELARRLRHELGSSVYLVAMTGYGQPEDRRRALDAGFDHHMVKPADISTIESLVKHVGERHELAHAAEYER